MKVLLNYHRVLNYLFCFLLVIILYHLNVNIFRWLHPIDEGQWLFFARQLLNGKILYKDVWYQFGPFIAIGLKWAMILFGKTLEVERTYFFSISFIGIGAFYLFSTSIIRAPSIRMLLCVIVYINSLTCQLAMVNPAFLLRQCFNLLPLYLIFQYYPKDNKMIIRFSGSLSLISILISQETGIFSLATIFVYIGLDLLYHEKNRFSAIYNVLYFLSGFCLCLFFWLLYCFFNHSLTQYFSISFRDVLFMTNNYQHVALPGCEIFFKKMGMPAYHHFLISYFPLLLCVISFLYFLFHKEKNQIKILCISVYGMFSFVILTGRGDVYHSTYAGLSLFLLMGGYYEYLKNCKNVYVSIGLKVIILSICLLILYFNMDNIIKVYEYYRHSKEITYEIDLPYMGGAKIKKSQYHKIYDVKNLIESNSAEKDLMLYLVHSPYYYFFIDRPTDTKYASPIFANATEAKSQIIDSINRKVYKFIVFDQTVLFPNIDYDFYFKEISSSLSLNYDKWQVLREDLIILKRKE